MTGGVGCGRGKGGRCGSSRSVGNRRNRGKLSNNALYFDIEKGIKGGS